jgi:hypothetical protein
MYYLNADGMNLFSMTVLEAFCEYLEQISVTGWFVCWFTPTYRVLVCWLKALKGIWDKNILTLHML